MGEALIKVFTDSLTAIQGDVMSMVSAAMPAGLTIMGIFLAVRLGVKFYHSVAK